MSDSRPSDISFPDFICATGKAEPSTTEFLSLFLKEQNKIYSYLVTLLVDPHVAEDIFQETALILLRKFDEFEPGSNFFTWACQTGHYLVLNYRRRKDHRLLIFDEDVLEKLAVVPADEERLFEIRRAALYNCLDKLSPKDRQLLENRYSSTMNGKELAEQLGRSSGSVYRSLGRIRRAMLECLRRSFASAEFEGSGW